MRLESHVWLLTGLSPLMQSNPDSMIDSSDDESELKKMKKKYDDKHEAEIRTYRYDGHYVHPSSSIRNVLCTAATGAKFGKTAARFIISGGVFPSEEWIVILDAEGRPFKKYEIDKRSVVIGKSRVMRCRPKFVNWKMKVALDIDPDMVLVDQITGVFNLAGRNNGLGEYRPDPSKGKSGVGTYGRFEAEFVS